MFRYIVRSTSNLKHSYERHNQATVTMLLRLRLTSMGVCNAPCKHHTSYMQSIHPLA